MRDDSNLDAIVGLLIAGLILFAILAPQIWAPDLVMTRGETYRHLRDHGVPSLVYAIPVLGALMLFGWLGLRALFGFLMASSDDEPIDYDRL